MNKSSIFSNSKSVLFTLFFCFVLGNSSIFAEVKPARLFSDHVVLQRQKPIPIWGWANANESVNVSLGRQNKTANADANGKFLVKFAPMEATGEPLELKVTARSGNLTVKDVLIGEVWLYSGQSNMEFTIKQAGNFAEEKKDADYPQIRHLFVEHFVQITPQNDLKSGEWKISSAETVGDFMLEVITPEMTARYIELLQPESYANWINMPLPSKPVSANLSLIV